LVRSFQLSQMSVGMAEPNAFGIHQRAGSSAVDVPDSNL